MSGKMRVLATDTIQTYSLINMKKTLLFAQLLIKFVLPVQYLESVSLLEYLKKNGEFGEEYFLKVEKFLESFLSIEVKSSGLKLGRA